MGLLGVPVEYGTQLLLRDDRTFIFRKLKIAESSLVDYVHEKPVIAWPMLYKLMKRFEGYARIGAGMVTICYNRDIILDPLHQMPEKTKPVKGSSLQKDFIRKLAEAKCYQHEYSARPTFILDKMTVFIGITMILLALALGIKLATH